MKVFRIISIISAIVVVTLAIVSFAVEGLGVFVAIGAIISALLNIASILLIDAVNDCNEQMAWLNNSSR